jgi:hypothetical protein
LDANETVWFALPRESGEDQVWEGLRAYRADGVDRAQIRAVHLFVYDLNYGDEVTIMASAEGALVATGVVSDGGHHTYRIWREDADADALRQMVTEFGQLGCYIEAYTERLTGLSCERDAAQAVADALLTGEKAGRFVYETGRQRTH